MYWFKESKENDETGRVKVGLRSMSRVEEGIGRGISNTKDPLKKI